MKICLISSGIEEANRIIQPLQYLFQGAYALNESEHEVIFISDGHPRLAKEDQLAGFPVYRLNTLNDWYLRGNTDLVNMINTLKPEAVLWHLGLTSFFHLNTLKYISAPVIGILTSPIYHPRELYRLGTIRLLRNHRDSGVHILGSFVPSAMIKGVIEQGLMMKFVVECETTRVKLMQKGVPAEKLRVIKPYINPIWFQDKPDHSERIKTREELGFSSDDFVVSYFGPPAPFRGLSVLVKAGKFALNKNSHILLLVLSRQRAGKQDPENIREIKVIKEQNMEQRVHLLPGVLSQDRLVQTLSVSDAIALPFELVSSDVPISVLEAMALSLPLITTDVACLPEMVPEGSGILVPPGNISRLAEALINLSTDKHLSQSLGTSGREQARSWVSISENHEAWNKLLDDAI